MALPKLLLNWLTGESRPRPRRNSRTLDAALVPAIESLEDRVLLSAVSWTAAGSGDFGEANNWSPAEVPDGAEYEVTFNMGSPVVSFRDGAGNPLSPSSESVTVSGTANVEFSMLEQVYSLQQLSVDGARLKILDGTVAESEFPHVGAEVEVSGAGARLQLEGAALYAVNLTTGSQAGVEVLVDHQSFLAVTNELLVDAMLLVGAQSTLAHHGLMQIGTSANDSGFVSVIEDSDAWSHRVEVNSGLLAVGTGGLMIVPTDARVGRYASAAAEVFEAGALEVDGTLQIGDNAFDPEGEHAARLEVVGGTIIGPAFVPSRVDVGILWVGGEYFGFDVGETTLDVTEGGRLTAGIVVIGPKSFVMSEEDSPSNQVVVQGGFVFNGQALGRSELIATTELIVGDMGSGSLRIEGGLVTSTDETSVVGQSAGGLGVVTVSGSTHDRVAFAGE